MKLRDDAVDVRTMPSESPRAAGGLGGCAALLADDDDARGDLALVRRAIVRQWRIPPGILAELPGVLAALMRDAATSDRVRVRAMELLAQLEKMNRDSAVQADRIDRLERGKPTENVAEVVYEVRFDGDDGAPDA